jgi:hypothetical protein
MGHEVSPITNAESTTTKRPSAIAVASAAPAVELVRRPNPTIDDHGLKPQYSNTGVALGTTPIRPGHAGQARIVAFELTMIASRVLTSYER